MHIHEKVSKSDQLSQLLLFIYLIFSSLSAIGLLIEETEFLLLETPNWLETLLLGCNFIYIATLLLYNLFWNNNSLLSSVVFHCVMLWFDFILHASSSWDSEGVATGSEISIFSSCLPSIGSFFIGGFSSFLFCTWGFSIVYKHVNISDDAVF